MSKMFENVINRIMENDKGSEEIKVGTKATEYLFSRADYYYDYSF